MKVKPYSHPLDLNSIHYQRLVPQTEVEVVTSPLSGSAGGYGHHHHHDNGFYGNGHEKGANYGNGNGNGHENGGGGGYGNGFNGKGGGGRVEREVECGGGVAVPDPCKPITSLLEASLLAASSSSSSTCTPPGTRSTKECVQERDDDIVAANLLLQLRSLNKSSSSDRNDSGSGNGHGPLGFTSYTASSSPSSSPSPHRSKGPVPTAAQRKFHHTNANPVSSASKISHSHSKSSSTFHNHNNQNQQQQNTKFQYSKNNQKKCVESSVTCSMCRKEEAKYCLKPEDKSLLLSPHVLSSDIIRKLKVRLKANVEEDGLMMVCWTCYNAVQLLSQLQAKVSKLNEQIDQVSHCIRETVNSSFTHKDTGSASNQSSKGLWESGFERKPKTHKSFKAIDDVHNRNHNGDAKYFPPEDYQHHSPRYPTPLSPGDLEEKRDNLMNPIHSTEPIPMAPLPVKEETVETSEIRPMSTEFSDGDAVPCITNVTTIASAEDEGPRLIAVDNINGSQSSVETDGQDRSEGEGDSWMTLQSSQEENNPNGNGGPRKRRKQELQARVEDAPMENNRPSGKVPMYLLDPDDPQYSVEQRRSIIKAKKSREHRQKVGNTVKQYRSQIEDLLETTHILKKKLDETGNEIPMPPTFKKKMKCDF